MKTDHLVVLGRLGRPHGLKGDLLLDSCTFEAEELLAMGTFYRRGADGRVLPLVLKKARPHGVHLQVRFQGYSGREQASVLTNGELLADRDLLPDPGPGRAYAFQIVGMHVETTDGRALGRVVDILQTGAHPVYVVSGEKELLIPATDEVVRSIDVGAERIEVVLPEGLEDL